MFTICSHIFVIIGVETPTSNKNTGLIQILKTELGTNVEKCQTKNVFRQIRRKRDVFYQNINC